MQRESSLDAPAREGDWTSKMIFRAPEDVDLRRSIVSRLQRTQVSPIKSFAPELELLLKDLGVEFIGRPL